MSVDITIQETIEEVDITINQNVIEVNVTRTSGGGGVQSVTGNVVDNTDPLNPVINITIPDVPTLQEVCDERNSLLDTSIISETSSGESTAMTGGAIIFSNLSNPLTTYISNRTLQIVDSGNTATVLLPTPTDVGGTVIFPSVGSDLKTVAYAEDFPKSLELEFTQSGTSDPDVTSLVGNRGATVTAAYAGSSQLRFTFNLPILANVKDSFKGDTNRNVFMTMAISGFNQNFYSFYAASDYMLIVEMFELVDGYINPADVGAGTPIRLKLDYKF